jgi:hypothetical protein
VDLKPHAYAEKEILTQQVRVGILVMDPGCYSGPRHQFVFFFSIPTDSSRLNSYGGSNPAESPRAVLQESFRGNGGCTYEVRRTHLYELEHISERRFFLQDHCSDLRQFAREGCAKLRKYAKLSEGDSQMASSIIVSNPAILSGEPVFRGTRVPFKSLTDYLGARPDAV